MSGKIADKETGIESVLKFWFEEAKPAQRFSKDPAFDREIRERFAALHTLAARCELFDWRSSDEGRLAEIILLDQFSRNLYRDDARAFAQDPLALALAQEAVRAGVATRLDPVRRSFVYMPYMHSESLVIHAEAMKLFAEPGLEDGFKFEKLHLRILEKFGRYPHRNRILGRESTPEEIEFLKTENSSF